MFEDGFVKAFDTVNREFVCYMFHCMGFIN